MSQLIIFHFAIYQQVYGLLNVELAINIEHFDMSWRHEILDPYPKFKFHFNYFKASYPAIIKNIWSYLDQLLKLLLKKPFKNHRCSKFSHEVYEHERGIEYNILISSYM